MPTFTKKPEVVDARQFTGGAKSGKDIVRWVSANDGIAHWEFNQTVEMEAGKLTVKTSRDVVHVRNHGAMETRFAFKDSWVIKHQDGHFATLLDEDFREGYLQA